MCTTSYFTFHYVSILMATVTDADGPLFGLYIPLCLYFNLIRQKSYAILNHLYIPLCLYFNGTALRGRRCCTCFTFHYVSILMQ